MWVSRIRERYDRIHLRNLKERAEFLYQLAEHNGELWLTYGGAPVIPTSLLNKDAIVVLQGLRDTYVSDMYIKK